MLHTWIKVYGCCIVSHSIHPQLEAVCERAFTRTCSTDEIKENSFHTATSFETQTQKGIPYTSKNFAILMF